MNQKELNEILKKHKLWLKTYGEEGSQATLASANLQDVNVLNCNL
jgi:hypothetical protein